MKKLIVGITAPASVDLITGQLNYFIKKGYDVYLLAPDTERVTVFCEKEGAKLIPIDIQRDISPLKDFKTLLNIIKLLRKHKPDIINLGTPKISLLGMIAARIVGVPNRIYTCRGYRFEHETGKFRWFLIFLEKIIAMCSHKVICVSKSVENVGVEEGIFKREKAIYIGKGSSNGINLTLFNPNNINREQVAEYKAKYGLDGYYTFGYVGRIVDRKGINELYEAFDNFYKDNKNIRLFVVGGPNWEQIKDASLIDRYNGHPGIIMAGIQPLHTIPLYMSLFDSFLLPAYWEGFANVLLQSSAMGIPVLTTDATGCRDAVSPNFNGMIVQPYSAAEFENGMRYLYNNPEEAARLGRNGLVWIKNYEPGIIWKGLEETYERMLEQKK